MDTAAKLFNDATKQREDFTNLALLRETLTNILDTLIMEHDMSYKEAYMRITELANRQVYEDMTASPKIDGSIAKRQAAYTYTLDKILANRGINIEEEKTTYPNGTVYSFKEVQKQAQQNAPARRAA